MRYLQIFVLLATVLVIPFVAFADVNVALNADVTLYDGPFFTGGWGGGATVNAQTVVDDVFLPKSTQWDQGAVWWDSRIQQGMNLVLDLNGVFEITQLIVQADDNDWYILSYRNGADPWQVAWNVPAVGGVGMQTRPNPALETQRFDLATPIVATELKFMGNDSASDWWYSVSEIQAFGHKVPEPATMLLFGAGLAGIWSFRKKIN